MTESEEAEKELRQFAREIGIDADVLLKQAQQYAKTFEGTYGEALDDFPKWFKGDLDQAGD